MRKKNSKKFSSLIIRYLILVLIALPNLALFYLIFTPLTVYPVFYLLDIFYDASLMKNIINLGLINIEIINACIAGSAYYLLTILNLSTPKIRLNKRINILLISFLAFLILNILRIFILSVIAVSGNSIFDITHKIFWYAGSTIFVVGIWFFLVKKFKIKQIPFYSDLKFIYKKTNIKL